MAMYEQDFLCTYNWDTNLTNADTTTGMQWLKAMNTAAEETKVAAIAAAAVAAAAATAAAVTAAAAAAAAAGAVETSAASNGGGSVVITDIPQSSQPVHATQVTLQLCMMCACHVLATTDLSMVTNGRGTSDNGHTGAADLYPLGTSGLLMGAVGIWSSRDNVFTSPHETNCPKGNCSNTPDFRLQNVAAVLSGGPYGPSDGIDFLNAPLIMRSCRTDGVLLKADAPIATLDAAFLGANFDSRRPACVWGTFSQIGSLRWSYILSVSTTSELTITLKEVGATPDLDYMLLDFWATNGSTPTASSMTRIDGKRAGTFVVPQSTAVPDKESDTGTYQILAPVLSSGWCLLGEALKIVSASKRRISSVAPTPDGLRATVRAAVGEQVTLWVLPPIKWQRVHGSAVIEVQCATARTCSGMDCDVLMALACAGGSDHGSPACRCT
jgi:hypothetical protein